MTDHRLHLDMYINYPGHCQEAFRFYEKHLRAKVMLMAVHEAPPPHFPKAWKCPILHAVIDIGGTLLRGADIPGAEPMRSAYLTLRLPTSEEAERIYGLLSEGGEVFMPMAPSVFANRFAMLRDRFGTSWMLLQGVS